MKAIVQSKYGSPDVFELKEIEMPAIKDNDLLGEDPSDRLQPAEPYQPACSVT